MNLIHVGDPIVLEHFDPEYFDFCEVLVDHNDGLNAGDVVLVGRTANLDLVVRSKYAAQVIIDWNGGVILNTPDHCGCVGCRTS